VVSVTPENLPYRFAGKSVLIAEDEPRIRKLLEQILVSAGFSVLPTADGQDALELSRAQSGPIDLLVTNVKMPRLNGVDLANRIRAERPGIKILIISGETSGQLEKLSTRADFLKKPFLPRALLEKIAYILDEPTEGTLEI
jgi:two-component system cell cycle sensor histidine kinase/response regulator CckA